MNILKNAVYCKDCQTEIESKHVHDFVICPGKHIAVDGGHDYLRRVSFVPEPNFEDRSQTRGAATLEHVIGGL